MKKVEIYTDGACSGNPGRGGWGAVLIYNGVQKEISGFEPQTTNNRMELKAPIEALKILKEKCEVNIYTDSRYVQEGITKWILNWQKNGWRNSSKEEIKNADLWQELLTQSQKHQTSWHWVKGHSNNIMNNLADKLATSAIENNR
ncbi:MAG: ribonuclease HI [Rickettsiales bacterium]|nr:ribonuclease HI [Rickettsiales bacterium]